MNDEQAKADQEVATGKLRIHADFNSCIEDDRGIWCWALFLNGRGLDEVAEELGLRDGMPVSLYFREDREEVSEYDAVLGHIAKPGWQSMWMALPDWGSIRRLRVVEEQEVAGGRLPAR